MAEKIDIPERIAQLVAEGTFEGDNYLISSAPKIQRFPAFLRQNPDFAMYSSPRVISFGPIHHGSENLKLGQRYKIHWASKYIEEYGEETKKNTKEEAAHFLHDTVQGNIGELKMLFAEDVMIESRCDDKELAWMLFVDGCSLLYFMEHFDNQHPEALNIKLELLMFIWIDAMLLENQLPMRLLELLSKQNGDDLDSLMNIYETIGATKRTRDIAIPLQRVARPTHILHFCRSVYIGNNQQHGCDQCSNQIISAHPPRQERLWLTYKNIRDLKKAGIRVKANGTAQWTNVCFTSRWFSGELRLPVFNFSDASPYFFGNVIAYELCPDHYNYFECCSYFSFMDSLIDNAEDVKELILAGVFQNWLGSDEELAKLFNEFGHNLTAYMFHHTKTDVVPYSKRFIGIKLQMQNHCKKKWKTWLAELHSTHFSTPWSLIAFLAALLALVLSSIQTWYAMHPPQKN